jgi:hypothetical protein
LTRAITFGDAVLLARDLADDHVVLVVSRGRDDDVGRPGNAGALEHEELGRVPVLHLMLELLLERLEAVSPLLDRVTSWPAWPCSAGSVRARFAPTLPPPAMRTYIRLAPSRRSRPARLHRVGQTAIAFEVGQTTRSPACA